VSNADVNVTDATAAEVMRVADIPSRNIHDLLRRYGVSFTLLAQRARIAGSFWGEPEAGIIGKELLSRPDTPIHSVLHELCHLICMTPERRRTLEGDAGGDDLEEAAVCYLQVVLADSLSGVGRDRLMADMDAWGYSFRLGSTRQWFEQDAGDARAWLESHGLLLADGRAVFRLRSA